MPDRHSTLAFVLALAATAGLLGGAVVAQGPAAPDAAAADPAAGPPPLVDTVGTLELSEPLASRGNLGGVTVDLLGFVYVANFRDAVWRISPEGEVETLARSFYGSSGNAVAPDGALYQASFFGHTIDRISRTGEVTRVVDQGLQGPVGLVVDPADGALYVCNCQGNTLSKVTIRGRQVGVTELARSERFACPNGIVLGPDDAFYVTNFNHHDILRVTKEGEVSVFATVPGGAGNAHLTFSKGFFYVTKIIANQVVKISAEGEVFPLAGTGQPGHDDGPAPEATLHRPNGIAAAPGGGLLYVNTLVGEYNGQQPAELTVRTIDLLTLTELLEAALETGGEDRLGALEAAYRRFRADPVRGRERTAGEMVALGFKLLTALEIPEALRVFQLNAETYPDSAGVQYQLGEAYRYIGQTDQAAAQYEKALELDPEHALARSRLEQLESDG